MNRVQSHKVGLVFGGLMMVFHACWSLMVLMGIAKPFMDWILSLHFMTFQYSINDFSIGSALMLVIVTGIIGYLMGWVLGWLWNWAHKTSHSQM